MAQETELLCTFHARSIRELNRIRVPPVSGARIAHHLRLTHAVQNSEKYRWKSRRKRIDRELSLRNTQLIVELNRFFLLID